MEDIIIPSLNTIKDYFCITGCELFTSIEAELFDVIKANDLDKVKILITEGSANINAKDRDGNTFLNITLKLTEKLSITLYPTKERENQIEELIKIAKFLIENGADVNTKNNRGITPLMLCADYFLNNLELIKLLLQKGADVNARNNWGETVLFVNGGLEIFKYLIDNGVDINAKDDDGDTALMRQRGELQWFEIDKLLIENGADINIKNNKGKTILWWSYGDFEFVEYLIEKGIDVNAKNNEGETALFNLCENSYNEDKIFEVMILLIENGADVNIRNNKGKTALEMCNWSWNLKKKLNEYDTENLIIDACKKGNVKIAKLLIKNHFDVNVDDDYNFKLLSIVCEKGHFEILNLLIEKGADVNAKNDNYALKLLSIACEEGHFEIAKLLIDNGADVNAKDKYGYRALDYTYNIKIFNLLLDNGADINPLLVTMYNNCMLKKYFMYKSKERSVLLKEELIAKYYSPENIEKWSVTYNKPFDDVIEVM